MNEPKVRVDSFWGDLVNALLLRPPFREPAQPVKNKGLNGNVDNGASS